MAFTKCANNGAKNFMQIAMIYMGISTMEKYGEIFLAPGIPFLAVALYN